MDGRGLRIWRQDHRLTLEQLAEHLRKHPNTVRNWEKGRSPVPVFIAADLERIAINIAPDPALKEPDWVAPPNRELRGDLDLYSKISGSWVRGSEHPGRLLGEPHPLMHDGKWPWSVLNSLEYQQALKAKRSKPRDISPWLHPTFKKD